MAAKIAQVSGSYDKKVPDSGDGAGLAAQSAAKFTKSVNKPTDAFKKPTDKGNKGSVKYSGGESDPTAGTAPSHSIP